MKKMSSTWGKGTPIFCCYITKDGMAMWPSGCALVTKKVWHAVNKKPSPGFYTIEVIDHGTHYEAYRVLELNRTNYKTLRKCS